MKRRIRTLVRSGWTLIEVDRLKDEEVDHANFGRFHADPNPTHYKTLFKWCEENVPLSDWTASFIQCNHTNNKGGRKRFVFKDEKFASWFTLMTKV